MTAAGNQGPDGETITAPGGGFRVITVGASVSRPGNNIAFVSPYSSRGPASNQRDKPDVVAPGGFRNPAGEVFKDVSIVSSRLANSTLDGMTSDEKPWQVDADHFGLSGTSQATAVVSAACALILEERAAQQQPVTHSQVANALRKSARKLGFSTYEQGQGLVDVDGAIAKI